MKSNEQTKQHRGGDRHTNLKPCIRHISDKRPFYKKIGIVLINLGKKTSPTTRLRQILPFTSQGS